MSVGSMLLVLLGAAPAVAASTTNKGASFTVSGKANSYVDVNLKTPLDLSVPGFSTSGQPLKAAYLGFAIESLQTHTLVFGAVRFKAVEAAQANIGAITTTFAARNGALAPGSYRVFLLSPAPAKVELRVAGLARPIAVVGVHPAHIVFHSDEISSLAPSGINIGMARQRVAIGPTTTLVMGVGGHASNNVADARNICLAPVGSLTCAEGYPGLIEPPGTTPIAGVAGVYGFGGQGDYGLTVVRPGEITPATYDALVTNASVATTEKCTYVFLSLTL